MHPRAALLALLCLAGCATAPTPIVDRAPAEVDVLSRVFAAIDQAIADLMTMPATPARSAVRLNLGVAQSGRLAPSAPAHVAEAKAVSDAALAGDTAKAEALASAARDDVAAKLAVAEHERDQAKRALEDERKKHAAELAAERENFSKSVRRWIVAGLYIAAVICVGLAILRAKAALTTGLAPLAAVKSAGFLLGAAGSLVSLAKLVGAWWFEYACYAVAAAIVGWITWLVVREQRLEQAKRAAKAVVKRLDDLYDEAADDRKELDAIIFDPLSEDMKAIAGAKEAIHLLRAEGKAAAPAA